MNEQLAAQTALITVKDESASSPLQSCLIHGEVFHERFTPVPHKFRYPVHYYCISLHELPLLDEKVRGFGYNRRSPVSLWDRDFLGFNEGGEGLSLMEKVKRRVREHAPELEVATVTLVTNPRFFGYIFNPVSFFWCYSPTGELVAFLADVNNTYGDGHLYFVRPFPSEKKGFQYTNRQKKSFHVSPFFDRSGDYEFHFDDIRTSFAVRIAIRMNTRRDFVGETYGVKLPLSEWSALQNILQTAIRGSLTFPRILWQAGRLRFQRRLAIYRRPIPDVAETHTVRGATLLEKLSMWAIFRLLGRIERGQVRFLLPDGSSYLFGGGRESIDQIKGIPTVRVRHYRLFPKLIFGTEVAAGESYMAGDWESDEIAEVLSVFAVNKYALDFRKLKVGVLARTFNRLRHLMRSNTRAGSKLNIAAHYDLSNDLFETFLDTTMTYSAALFRSSDKEKSDEPLEEAQARKLDSIIQLGDIQPHHHVLEIGCGWGSFALKAAREVGCQVTCLTLSKEQKEFAEIRIQEAGLSHLIQIHLEDYRDTARRSPNSFDRVVSIEMIEAVGEENLPTYFKAIQSLLKGEGRAVLQAITIKDERLPYYRKGCDFIQKHIFPGCFVPSFPLLQKIIKGETALTLEGELPLGLHYAKTLKVWRERFLKNSKLVEGLGFSKDFMKKWEYYLAYCEAGFTTGELDTFQIVLRKNP